jgi:transposase IS4-like protein/DDE family transposase
VSGVVPVAEGVPELSGLGVLTWVYPPDLVGRVVAACGRAPGRAASAVAAGAAGGVLRAGLGVVLACAVLEVLRHLTEGLRDLGGWGSWRVPAKSSLFRARERLGAEPLRVLVAATAGPPATPATPATPSTPSTPSTPGAFWRGLRLVAVDGWCWDAADTPANDREFGRPGAHRGEGGGAFPRVRMVALVECGTHAVVDAELAGCRVGETTLAVRVARSAGPGVLVLADRGFLGVPWGAAVACRGRHRGAPAVAGAGQPGPGRRAGAAGRVVALAAVRGRRPARPPQPGAGSGGRLRP